MAREKKTHRIELTEGKRNIIQQLLRETFIVCVNL